MGLVILLIVKDWAMVMAIRENSAEMDGMLPNMVTCLTLAQF